ncbi:hypothetical protein MPER_09914 [Moniliophthora perniciosa FA553]|nr:hypothetical protein MPER_09914 [Moniliophthora perniciosa FA553]
MVKAEGAGATSPKQKRGPRHCKKCPGNILQTDCFEHGAKHARARRLRQKQNATQSQDPAQASLVPVEPQNPVPATPPAVRQEAPPPVYESRSGACHSPVIDPILLEESTFPLPDPTKDVPLQHEGIPVNTVLAAPESPPSISVSHTTGSGRIAKIRIRPSQSNPTYGLVDGVLRGTTEWRIPRIRARKSILHEKKIHKRFDEKVTAIANRCEELGDETGAWVQFSAHFPGARHGAVQYFSKRFRKEAPQGVEDLMVLSGKVFKALVNSRRKDVVQAELEIAHLRAQAEAAHAAEASSKADVAALTRTNEMQSDIISQLHRDLQYTRRDRPGSGRHAIPAGRT